MKQKIKTLFILAVLAFITLGGAQLFGLPYGQTIRGMYRAATGSPGTAIYRSANQIVFIWNQGSQYAYAATGLSGESIEIFLRDCGNGTCGNPQTITELLRLMLAKGFYQITPQELPPGAFEAVASLGGMLARFTSALPTPILQIVPADGSLPFGQTIPQS